MARADKLLKKALNNAGSLKFSEICRLAKYFSYTLDRQKGDHDVYTRPGVKGIQNFQNWGGNAKPYQVRQLLNALREQGDIPEDA